MKAVNQIFLTATFLISWLISSPLYAYDIRLEFLSDNPMIFRLGSILPDDLSESSEIKFEEIDAFFQIFVTAGENDNPQTDRLFLHIRLEKDNDVLFTVRSQPFDISLILDRNISNQDLNYIPNIGFDHDGNTKVRGKYLMSKYVDGGNLSEGFYILTLLLSDSQDWQTAKGKDHNRGMVSRSILIYNPSQVDLIEPINQAIINDDHPTFSWLFPVNKGIIFNLNLVKADSTNTPNSALEPEYPWIFTSIDLPVADWQVGGFLSSHSYTGILNEKPLEPGTYYWVITAKVPTMFPDQYKEVLSPIYSFVYSPLGGGGDNIDEEENPPPDNEAPIFNVLREYLSGEQIVMIQSVIGDLSEWEMKKIKLGDSEVSIAQLARFLSEGNINIVTVSVVE